MPGQEHWTALSARQKLEWAEVRASPELSRLYPKEPTPMSPRPRTPARRGHSKTYSDRQKGGHGPPNWVIRRDKSLRPTPSVYHAEGAAALPVERAMTIHATSPAGHAARRYTVLSFMHVVLVE